MSKDEFGIMKEIEGLLSPLDEQTRARVLTWANLRFLNEQPLPVTKTPQTPSLEENNPVPSAFETIADLVNECEPKTNMDRALAGAYWVQVIEGEKSWKSLKINTVMSKIGMRIPDINHVMSRAQKKRPALALVVEKSGQAAQAQKRYKLTSAGIKYVESMFKKDDLSDV